MVICRQKNCPRRPGIPSRRPKCAFAESVQILLGAGCSLTLDDIFHWRPFSFNVREAYAFDLLRRRECLMALALRYFTAAQSDMYDLHSPSVLDANLAAVVEAFKPCGFPLIPHWRFRMVAGTAANSLVLTCTTIAAITLVHPCTTMSTTPKTPNCYTVSVSGTCQHAAAACCPLCSSTSCSSPMSFGFASTVSTYCCHLRSD